MGTRKTRKIQVRSGRLVPQRRTARARARRGVRTRGARVQVSRTHLAHVLRIALIGWWNIACVVVCTAPSRANTPAAVRRRAEETHLFNRVWLSSLRRGCPVVLLHPFHRGACVGRSFSGVLWAVKMCDRLNIFKKITVQKNPKVLTGCKRFSDITFLSNQNSTFGIVIVGTGTDHRR